MTPLEAKLAEQQPGYPLLYFKKNCQGRKDLWHGDIVVATEDEFANTGLALIKEAEEIESPNPYAPLGMWSNWDIEEQIQFLVHHLQQALKAREGKSDAKVV